MKKILVAIASFILLHQASAQSTARSEVPSNVTKWEIRKEGKIAHFKKDGRKHYAYYTHDGQWKATESPVRRTRHLPEAVQTAWKNSGYTNWYVHNIRKIETAEQQLYVLHLNNTVLLDANKVDNFKEDHVLYFTREGELVKTERI